MDAVVDPATLETQVMDGETLSVDMTLAKQIRWLPEVWGMLAARTIIKINMSQAALDPPMYLY